MCNRRHRSHGGITRSPLGIDSILLTISDLKGPPSSRSRTCVFTCGIREAGVFGIATDVCLLSAVAPGNSIESDLGLASTVVLDIDCVRGVPNEDRRAASGLIPESRSVEDIKFFIISALSVGEAPLMDRPLMYVTLPVLEPGKSSSGPVAEADSGSVDLWSGLTTAPCLLLTAMNPDGGD